jgi:hypothetical protein
VNFGLFLRTPPLCHRSAPLGSWNGFWLTPRPGQRSATSAPEIASGNLPTPDKFECIGRGRSAWYTKAELSDRADSETPRRLPHADYVLHRRGCSQEDDQLLREGWQWHDSHRRHDQALSQMQQSMPEIMHRLGLTRENLIEKHLKSASRQVLCTPREGQGHHPRNQAQA